MKTTMNIQSANPESTGFKENPIHLFTAVLDYLIAYSKALVKEIELADMDVSVPVICMAPDVKPYLTFSDMVDFLDNKEDVMFIREQQTGLMMAFGKGELVSREEDDGLLLIGPAMLFRYDEESLISVSSSDLNKAEIIFLLGQDEYEIGPVKVPAILIGQAGDLTL